MADQLDDELYPHNDVTVVAEPTVFRRNPTTAVAETIVLTGRTDGVAFLSTVQDISTATPIHASLSVPLVEIGSTGVYTGVLEGANLAAQLGATAEGTVLYRHWQFGSDARRVNSVIWRRVRP